MSKKSHVTYGPGAWHNGLGDMLARLERESRVAEERRKQQRKERTTAARKRRLSAARAAMLVQQIQEGR